MHWLIAYDIRADRRRSRVAKRLERAGLRVQKSVFVAELARGELDELMNELNGLIDVRTDTLAAWALPHDWSAGHREAGLPNRPLFEPAVVW